MNFYWSIVALHFLDSTVVKYPPALQEMQVPSLDWEDPLEKGRQPTPIFLPGEFHGQRSLTHCSPWGRKRAKHDLVIKQQPPPNKVAMEINPLGKRVKRQPMTLMT